MAHPGSDNMPQSNSVSRQRLLHHICCLLLRIIFATESNSGAVCQIQRPFVTVIKIPKFLLPGLRLQLFLLEDFQELWSFREAGTRSSSEPAVRIMRGELPAGRAAH